MLFRTKYFFLIIEWPWAICCHCSFKMGDREWIAPVALKKSKIRIRYLGKSESLFRSFAHKKSDSIEKAKSEFSTQLLYYLLLIILGQNRNVTLLVIYLKPLYCYKQVYHGYYNYILIIIRIMFSEKSNMKTLGKE